MYKQIMLQTNLTLGRWSGSLRVVFFIWRWFYPQGKCENIWKHFFICHKEEGILLVPGVEARHFGKHPIMHKPTLHKEEFHSPYMNSILLEKLLKVWSLNQQSWHHQEAWLKWTNLALPGPSESPCPESVFFKDPQVIWAPVEVWKSLLLLWHSSVSRLDLLAGQIIC